MVRVKHQGHSQFDQLQSHLSVKNELNQQMLMAFVLVSLNCWTLKFTSISESLSDGNSTDLKLHTQLL